VRARVGRRDAAHSCRIIAGVATLYRCRTPTDWLCPCGRVARELRRRAVSYNEVRVPFRRRDRPEVEALSGQRHVPLLVIDGEAICDSKRIVEHLDWLSIPSQERSP
jgi:glutaredoxin